MAKRRRTWLVLLYAWNENSEGGYLTPTKGAGDGYLAAVGKTMTAARK